jgi:hypothetical protein
MLAPHLFERHALGAQIAVERLAAQAQLGGKHHLQAAPLAHDLVSYVDMGASGEAARLPAPGAARRKEKQPAARSRRYSSFETVGKWRPL